jgi:cytoskeletal protein CcmA (bactofilin family)
MARMVETMDSRRQNTHARTLIGADTRIAGKISFAGTFQTEGHVEGNIWCQTEGQGTILIGKTGQVIGSMRSEHVVVAGQVRGNIQAFNTLEIRDSARVLGDLAYRELLMQPGGVVDGVLKHSASDERAHLTSAPAATTPVARSVSRSRSRRGTSIAAAALCALAATIYLLWPAPERCPGCPANEHAGCRASRAGGTTSAAGQRRPPAPRTHRRRRVIARVWPG